MHRSKNWLTEFKLDTANDPKSLACKHARLKHFYPVNTLKLGPGKANMWERKTPNA
jgi:hypothetical protein